MQTMPNNRRAFMKMHISHIEFLSDGATESQLRTIRARSPGQAQFLFHQRYPGCKILKQWTEARVAGCYLGVIEYAPVSTIKVDPLPGTRTEETTFAFFDECRSRKKNL
jgi:hypothetical protein